MPKYGLHSYNGNSNDTIGSNNGTSTNITFVAGKTNQGGSNAGTGYTTIGTGYYDNIKATSTFSFSFLLNLTSLTGGAVIYSTQTNVAFYLYYDVNGKSRLRRELNFSDGANGDFETGKWIHYVVNYTSSTAGELWKNSRKIATYSISNTSNTSLGFVQGAYYNNSLPIRGTLDEFEANTSVMSNAEIKNKYAFYFGFF